MSEPTFSINFKEFPTLPLMGVCVRSTMEEASEVCARLWSEQFMPVAMPLVSDPDCGGLTYGLSIITDPEGRTFDYWAAMPLGNNKPDGFAEVTIPAGVYAGCHVSDLGLLNAAYEALYSYVMQAENLSLNMEAPCFEEYGPEYAETGACMIYVPVLHT